VLPLDEVVVVGCIRSRKGSSSKFVTPPRTA
jgi:hypothetical protein